MPVRQSLPRLMGGFASLTVMVNEPLRFAVGAMRGACRKRAQSPPGRAMEDAMSVANPVRHKRGGLYFEDFTVGELVEHRYTRTVTQMDNMLFSNMTLNPQPLHIDRHFCEQETEWGQPLMNSLFTLGLMIGIQVSDMTVGTTIANLGMT